MLELPAFEELDRSVLETLPEELKREVLEYYERSGIVNNEEGKEVERLLKWMMAMRREMGNRLCKTTRPKSRTEYCNERVDSDAIAV